VYSVLRVAGDHTRTVLSFDDEATRGPIGLLMINDEHILQVLSPKAKMDLTCE
jgi:hypothetical protein